MDSKTLYFILFFFTGRGIQPDYAQNPICLFRIFIGSMQMFYVMRSGIGGYLKCVALTNDMTLFIKIRKYIVYCETKIKLYLIYVINNYIW